ncbi:MAG: hypothetical protein WBV42_11730 [Haladaptatus sp.]
MVSAVSARRLGATLMGVAVVGFVLTLVVSAAVAPPISNAPSSGLSGRTVVGVQSTSTDGKVVVLDSDGEKLWSYGHANGDHDVSWLPNGTVLASFIDDGYRRCGPYESPCARTGVRVIDPNPSPHVVYQWTFPVRSGLNSEVHDAELLPSGELLIADMDKERVFTLAPNGTVTWQWNASERYDPPSDPTRTDWLHINDVDRIGPGRYLVSVRNANQLVVLQRGKGVVNVINENGDWGLLNKQHNPQYLSKNAVLVADSENDRVVELHRRNGTWGVGWQVHGAGGLGFDWPRDADRLSNGHTLITDSRNNRVVELNRSGKLVWSARISSLPYEADRYPGEYPAGPPVNSSADIGPSATKLPVFGYLLDSARHVVSLPYWVAGWHVAIGAIALVTFLAGVWLFARGGKKPIA